jgi:hypothetical protein
MVVDDKELVEILSTILEIIYSIKAEVVELGGFRD